MEYRKNRDEDFQEVDSITIQIGETRYRITESNVDGQLMVNKTDFNDGQIRVFPRYTNEIEIK